MNHSQQMFWKGIAIAFILGFLFWAGFAFFSAPEAASSDSGKLNVSSEVSHECSVKSREAQVCMALYAPVCGWFAETVQCFDAPCAATYSNSCIVCQNKEVVDWTDGECPIS